MLEPAPVERSVRGWISSTAVGRCAHGTHTSSWPGAPFLPSKGGSPACPLKGRLGSGGAPAWRRGVGAARQERSPEKRSQSSPRRALRDALQHQLPRSSEYIHPAPRTPKKWMIHDSSFIFSLAWGSSRQGVCGADPAPPPPLLEGWGGAAHGTTLSVLGCGQSEAHGQRCSTGGQAGCPWHCAGSPEGHRCHPTPARPAMVKKSVRAYPLGAQVSRISLEESGGRPWGGWAPPCARPLGGHRASRAAGAVPTAPGVREGWETEQQGRP